MEETDVSRWCNIDCSTKCIMHQQEQRNEYACVNK